MNILEIIASLLLLVPQFFKDDTIQEGTFFQEFSDKLLEICSLAIEQKLETDELIRLLTPLLDLLTENFSCLRIYRTMVLSILTESFSSLPLTFSLQKKDKDYQFVVEQKTISLSIQGSIMYETNAPTDCRTFLEKVVRLYPIVSTPVIQFWILSMGIFEDIFSTFGDDLSLVSLPTRIPKGHPHPFRFIEGYREFYKFDLFDQIFAILNKSVPKSKLALFDFHKILNLLKVAQNTFDENLEEYLQDRYISFFFLSALIGFQLRDMLSNQDDKMMVTAVLKIKQIEILQRNVKAQVKKIYRSNISFDFFKNQKNSTEVDYMYLQHAVTDFEENLQMVIKANEALQKFYDQLN